MSMRLRTTFALPAALAMVLFSSGAAFAGPGDGTETSQADVTRILETLPGTTTSGSADTSESKSSATTTSAPEATAADFAAAEVTITNVTTITLTQPGGSSTATSTSGTTTSNGSTTSSTSQNPGTCVAGVVQQLLEDLQEALGANGRELATAIQGALSNPANLPAFLSTGLPALLQEQGDDLSTEGELLLTTAGQDLQKCLPTPPTGGAGTQPPRPSQASGQYTPPAQQPFTYRNCDEARAAGKAPVYAGQYGYGSHLDSDYDGVGCEEQLGTYAPVAQPVAYASDSGKLAYTGVTVQPLIAWGTALALAGGWLILSGRRRA